MVLEVDMQPLTSGTAGFSHSNGHKLGPDTVSSSTRRHHGVEDECMDGTIPRHVDEANEVPALSSADPPEAVLMNLSLPVPVVVHEDFMVEASACNALTSELGATPPFVR